MEVELAAIDPAIPINDLFRLHRSRLARLDVAGVADAMGCRLGTAKSLIHRGLAHLKKVLEQ